MRNEVCQPIVRTLLDHVERGASWRVDTPSPVPASHYTDPAHLATELEILFRRLPQVIALSSEIAQPGSHVTRDLEGLPLVVTRSADGAVAALVNVCAHRGAQVASGRGCGHRLTCPYHSWGYDHAGTLVAIPDRDSFAGVAVPGPGLKRLPVVEAGGLVWIIADQQGDDPGGDMGVAAGLGPLADDFESFGIADMTHWRSHRFDLELNWKLVIDTFLEPYHFASLHRDTVGPLFFSNLCIAERFGSHLREVLPRRTIRELADQSPEAWDLVPHAAIVYVLVPNTVLVMQLDHIETWRVYPDPIDPNRCVCDLDFYIPDASTAPERYWESNWKLTIDTVRDEDFKAMADVQRGLRSGAIDRLRLGMNEPALGMFHSALADAMSAGR